MFYLFKTLKKHIFNITIEWSMPRLLCIAGDFTKYDEHAVKQINRNIELIRYKKYEDDLILFELVNVTTASQTPSSDNLETEPYAYKTDNPTPSYSNLKEHFLKP